MTNNSSETSQDIPKDVVFRECDCGYFQLVMSLLKKYQDGEIKEDRGWLGSLLESAVQCGKLEVVEFLAKELGVNINSGCNNTGLGFGSALIAAVKCNNLVEDLINMGADVNLATDVTPLTEACKYGDLTAVKQLLSKGAKVNMTTSRGLSPLMAASSNQGDQAIEIMKCLLDRGAECNMQNNYGTTALHFAILSENAQAVTLLLQHKVKMLRDKDGLTPILFAVYHDSEKIFNLLQSSQLITRPDKVNALEYRAAFLAPVDMKRAYRLLHQAMEIRFKDLCDVLYKPVCEPVAAFGNVCESQTLEELEARKGMKSVLLMECLVIADRLFGRYSIEFIQKFDKIWKTLFNAGLYDTALSLVEYEIEYLSGADAKLIVMDMVKLASKTTRISVTHMLSTTERGLQCAIKMLKSLREKSFDIGWPYDMVLSCLKLLNACIEFDVTDKPRAQIQAKCFIALFPLPESEFCTSLHAATFFLLNKCYDFDICVYKSLVQVLVKCAANIDEKDQDGKVIMVRVFESDMSEDVRKEIVDFLLKQGASDCRNDANILLRP